MQNVLHAFLTIILIVFIFSFNVFGNNWDMGGYDLERDRPAGLAFQVPVIFPGSPPQVKFIEGQEVVLTTGAVGGNLTHQWYLNGNPIPGAKENYLLAFGAQVNTSGLISLKSTNEFGIAEVGFEVEIVSKKSLEELHNKAPQVLSFTGGGKAVLGLPYTLAVTATGANNTFRWYKNGSLIINANSYRLHFESLKRFDGGTYHVEISNPYGKTHRRMRVWAVRELE